MEVTWNGCDRPNFLLYTGNGGSKERWWEFAVSSFSASAVLKVVGFEELVLGWFLASKWLCEVVIFFER